MRKLFISLILVTVSLLTFGQEQTNNSIKRIKINEFYLQTGLTVGSYSVGSLNDFKNLSPNSVLLNSNLIPSPQTYGPIFFEHRNNSLFSVMLGFQFRDKQKMKYKNNIQLRVGISYSSNIALAGGMFNTERKTFDTLTSSQTGQLTFVDSVINRNLGMKYTADQLRIDGSLIFRTNPESRWSLFSGVGLTAGFSFDAKTEINYSQKIKTETRQSNNSYYNGFSFSGILETEEFKNKNNFGFSGYIPLGIDFRIGKKKEFWKRIHLYYEFRPTINVTYIPELGSYTETYVQHGMGIKIAM